MSVSSVPNAAWAVGFVTKSCSISSMYASAEAALVSVGASEMSAMTLRFVYVAVGRNDVGGRRDLLGGAQVVVGGEAKLVEGGEVGRAQRERLGAVDEAHPHPLSVGRAVAAA